jgi:hypothetical protein
MADVFRIKRRAAGGASGAPAVLAAAEVAFNEQDNVLYYGRGNSGGTATQIIPIAGPGAFLPLAGGTLTGDLTLRGDPTTALMAATRQYVDARGRVTLATIAALRAYTGSIATGTARVQGYYNLADGGAGDFTYIPTDTTSADDGGTVIIDGANRRWYRQAPDNIISLAHFGADPTGVTDATVAIQSWFNCARRGYVLLCPQGQYRISSTINVGDGTTTARSTLNNFTVIWQGNSGGEDAYINNTSTNPRTGCCFRWAGPAGGKMMRIAGPIWGLRWIGSPILDGGSQSPGQAGAGTCLEALSFQMCHFDRIQAFNWQSGGVGVAFGTLPVTNVGGDINCLTSDGNYIEFLEAFAPYAVNAICVQLDGYAAPGGQDFTVSEIGTIRCGFSLANSNGLVLGYTDGILIHIVQNVSYGTLSGTPAGLLLVSKPSPFPTPNDIRILQVTAGDKVGVRGSTDGVVIIDQYTLDDGAVIPGVPGLHIKALLTENNAGLNQLPVGPPTKVLANVSGDGIVGRDINGVHRISLTYQNAGAHIASYGDIEFECSQGGDPSLNLHYQMTTGLFSPAVDNVSSLGDGARRWATVYAATGSISTSDARRKIIRGTLSSEELAAWAEVSPLIYRLTDAAATKGRAARLHAGLTAQDVAGAFLAHGLDPAAYALWCRDVDSDGRETLGLRYDECHVFEAAFQRARVAALEHRLAKLEQGAR